MTTETFAQKLKSWKRWAMILATLMPIVGNLLTGSMPWHMALGASLMAILVGMGLITQHDVAKVKAAAAVETAKAMAPLASSGG